MSQNNQHSDPSEKKPTVNTGALFTVGAQVGGATLAFVFLALFLGLGLDKLFGTTKHPFTIILVLASAPLSLFVTYWIAMRAVKDINPQGTVKKPSGPEEEEKRD